MPRFWQNIQGDRTQIIVTPHDLRRPAHYKTGGMRRTGQEQAAWDARPTKRIAPYITAAANTTALSLKHQIAKVTAAHDDEAEPSTQRDRESNTTCGSARAPTATTTSPQTRQKWPTT